MDLGSLSAQVAADRLRTWALGTRRSRTLPTSCVPAASTPVWQWSTARSASWTRRWSCPIALILAHGDDGGEARAHQPIAQIQWCRNQHQESVFQNNLGLAYASLGRRDEAMVEFKVAVDDFERTGSEHGPACAVDNLASSNARTGANDEAMVHLQRTVAILARVGMGPDGVVAAMWQGGCW